ncbi:unnamed protein product [Adineta steineri]|uniref:NACHT domain-containing protein n=1 Tax=Adineta steineri TaxID=433720 RepID=A0A813SFD2_9BILA|nr:unnamed protein product [Adineta steineri]
MNRAVDGVEVVCCFMTPEYQDSINCKNELQYATAKKKHIIPCIIGDKQNKQWKPTDWLEFLTTGLDYIDLQEESDSNIRSKAEELMNRITNQSSTPSQYSLVNAIKNKYLKEDKIKRILNEEDTFSIEQSYINLAIVNIKEQHDSKILGTYEEIYGNKTPINIEQIFQKSKDPIKKVLVLGRPGIGKSTFCQYVTYRWAKGELWSCYEVIVLIDLLKLTGTRYPATKLYTAVDLVKREYASFRDLSDEEKKSFQQKFNNKNVLWILDGYDELPSNIPEQLKQCLNDIRDKQNHILTSSSYDIAISHDVKMEIIGFANDNIPMYVKQFFHQIEGELTNALSQGQQLLDFLYSNRSIWRVIRIPVNLELICRIWANRNWLETKALTMTALYDEFILWLCRRRFAKGNQNQEQMPKEAVYKQFDKELQFLERLAFKAMQNDKIILPSNLLQKTGTETGWYVNEHSQVLQMGILKPYDNKSFGSQIETTKQYCFIHPSYQELFAARHLLKTLKSSSNIEATHFINHNKYNQRFRLMFVFAAGLLAQCDYQSCTDTFWTTIQQEPIDLIGLQHFQLLTECIDELGDSNVFEGRLNLLKNLCSSFNRFLNMKANVIKDNVIAILAKTQNIPHNALVQNSLAQLLLISDERTKCRILNLIAQFPVLQPTEKLFFELVRQLQDASSSVRAGACTALGNISGNAVTKQLTDGLINALRDNNSDIRIAACEALGKLGEKAVTDKVIAGLIKALGAKDQYVQTTACKVLAKLGEKVTTNLVTGGVIHALAVDKNYIVRINACEVLGNLAEKAPTSEVLAALVNALRDQASGVKRTVQKALVKLGEKAITNEVITDLLKALHDEDSSFRSGSCEVLGSMGEKALTEEVIAGLNEARRDKNPLIRIKACEVLGKVDKKVVGDEVLTTLVDVLDDKGEWIRRCACEALGKIGEKAATKDVLDALMKALRDEDSGVRKNAGEALGKIGEKTSSTKIIDGLNNALRNRELTDQDIASSILADLGKKAAMNEVIASLINALRDTCYSVRKNACKALGNIGEKAVTAEVIAALINALSDADSLVTGDARQALAKLSKKAPTNELITSLSNALGHADKRVRNSACLVLREIGEKAATKEAITALINALGDEDTDVQSSACYALNTFGEKAATNELIAGLIEALGNKDSDVQRNACFIISWIGDKAGTNEMIAALNNALGNEDKFVGMYASKALGKIGEKAATAEVIAYLVNALIDKDSENREQACKALGNMGEKATTNEVLTALVSALCDKSKYVRKSACEALGKLGKKAATNRVLLGLINALRVNKNYDMCIREEACKALGNMGEKAATDEVLTGLVEALHDKKYDMDIREKVCETLGKIGGKAATEDVLGALTDAIRDKDSNEHAGKKACQTLMKFGGKAVTDKLTVIMRSTFSHGTQELEESAAPGTYNKELSCKGHPCPNCGQCRDWYFTGNAAELDWLRDEQHWDYQGDAWNRWCDDRFYLKFKPRDGKTCAGRRNFIFPFTVHTYNTGFHPSYHDGRRAAHERHTYSGAFDTDKDSDFPHGPVCCVKAVPLAENNPYDYDGYYSDFCACKDNVHKCD